MQTQQMLSLVDYLTAMIHCEYVSDLHVMDSMRKRSVYQALESIPADAYPLREWNDALCYVTRHVPQTTAMKARTELMEFLA